MAPDRLLAEKARQGDGGAYEELVRRYARLVWATIAGMVRDASWTEDLVQETFLRCWKSIGQLENPDAFRPWMLSTARRLVFRHTEMMGRTAPEAPPPAADSSDPEETREAVASAIQRLPERYRLPITLRFINGLDYRNISDELQLTNGALRGLLNRGVKLLRQELKGFYRSHTE